MLLVFFYFPAVLLGALFFYGAISLGGEFSAPLYALYTALLGIALYLLLSFEKEGNYFRLHRAVGAAVFVGAVLFYLAFYVFCAVYRLKSYSSVCFDFGIFVQMFHSMRQGLGMVTTLERNTLMSHFSVHFSPIYYLFLPFYAVFPAALPLLILQVLTTAASIVPAYLLCREKGLSKAMTGLFCAALLFSPVLGGGCLYDLHENCFLPVLLLWLFYFFVRGKYLPAFLFAALTMCVKEDAPVYLAFAALYFLLSAPRLLQKRERRRQTAAAGTLFLLSVGVFLTVTALMKQFGNGIMSNRYESLIGKQGSLVDLIRIAFTNPDAILRSLCDQGDKITYVLLVLLPLGALPLLTKKWERFVLLCPLVLCNLMPGYEYQHQLFFQYSFGPFAFLAFAAILRILPTSAGRGAAFSACFACCAAFGLPSGCCRSAPRYISNMMRRQKNTMPLRRRLPRFRAMPPSALPPAMPSRLRSAAKFIRLRHTPARMIRNISFWICAMRESATAALPTNKTATLSNAPMCPAIW